MPVSPRHREADDMSPSSLVLGSSSPRRRELLEAVGLRFGIVKPLTEEKPRPGEAPLAYALRNAYEKADWTVAQFRQGLLDSALRDSKERCIVLAADTIVVLDFAILEKPIDLLDAGAMLRRLSGRQHSVITGVALVSSDRDARAPMDEERFAVETKVWFKSLTERDIAAYVASGEPLDKAGAYAIQGLGSFLVTRIDGSYSNVVGLPVAEVVEALGRRFAYSLWRDPQF
jgi:septum formation protein